MRKEQVIMPFFSSLFVVYYNFRVDGSAILNLRLRYKTILYTWKELLYFLWNYVGGVVTLKAVAKETRVGLLQSCILLDDQLE
jgi:hypothetical protein